MPAAENTQEYRDRIETSRLEQIAELKRRQAATA
jgi:hypothetical protein